jgi:spoIIIJ-associated protein
MNIEEMIVYFFTNLLGGQPQLQIEQSEDSVNVNLTLDPSLSGIVIGYHGEVLSASQLLLSLMLQQRTGKWTPVRINVNDYREKRQQTLESLALDSADKVVKTQTAVIVRNLSSFERRIIHSALSNYPGIVTHSEGNPPHRVLIISPAQPAET